MTDIILPSKEDKEHIDNLVSSLFTQAKEKDAAEYIASVKYFFDMTSLHLKSPNDELGETLELIAGPLPEIHIKKYLSQNKNRL